MIALLDVPVSPSLVDVLRIFGYDGVHAVQIGFAKATLKSLKDRSAWWTSSASD